MSETATAAKRPPAAPLEQIARQLKKQRQAIDANKNITAEQRQLLQDFFTGAEQVFAAPPTSAPVAGSAAAALVDLGAKTRQNRALFFGGKTD